MSKLARASLFLFLAGLLSCNKPEKEAPVYRVIGEAFAGPNELPIRQELSLRSPTVTTAKHGEKLEILDRRRRYVQIRTKANVVGWVDMRLLISAKQIEELDALAKRYKASPSLGRATVFDQLNVHTDPNRFSPTFLQIAEKEHFDVIGHRVVTRVPFQGQSIEIEEENPEPASKKKRAARKQAARIEPPPPPPTPKVPENWLELSRTPVPQEPEKKTPAKAAVAPVIHMDDLSLIRTKDGKVGWVLTNALFLEVPDEVAQYAEGNRITSYFPMGEVTDDGKKHSHWLWTTQSQRYAPFDFDGLRLFTYNTRRHRYETSYRERGLRGIFPLWADTAKGDPVFSIVTETDGKYWRKSYSFDGTRVRSLGKQPYDMPADAPVSAVAPLPPKQDPTLMDRLKKMIPGK